MDASSSDQSDAPKGPARKTERRIVSGPRDHELRAIKQFVNDYFAGGAPGEGVTHAVARYLNRAYLPPTPASPSDVPYYRDQRHMKRGKMAGEVRMLIFEGKVRSPNEAYEKVGDKYSVSADTVLRAFKEIDGFAHLARDPVAFRLAIEGAVVEGKKNKR